MGPVVALAIPSCGACGLQSAARCPMWHQNLCLAHFPCDQHTPCSTRIERHPEEYMCFICGAPAVPRQWSSTPFSHYIDLQRCVGCHRSICAKEHTRLIDDDVVIDNQELRGRRYHFANRYCAFCAPLRPVGGLLGAVRWLVAVGGALVTGVLVYVQLLH